MKYLKISNPGEIELNAFRLIGASTKRGDSSKIGFFGSGLKYSMAYLLNNDIEFKIFSGETEIALSTKPVPYRGKDFKVILINGEETSMTTEMGPDWKTWFVIREIYCNAIDEGGGEIEVVDTPKAKAGETSFFIGIHKEIGEVLDNWHMYFSAKRPGCLYEKDNVKIFPAQDENLIVYRKGVQCYFSPGYYPIFHYDFPWVSINESRVIESTYGFSSRLVRFLFEELTDVKMLKTLIDKMCSSQYQFEKDLNWYNGSNIHPAWLEAIDGRMIVIHEISGWYSTEMESDPKKFVVLPAKLAEMLRNNFGDKVTVLGDGDTNCFFKKVERTQKHKFLLDEVDKFFNECQYIVGYPVEIVAFSNPKRLGTVKDKIIFISDKLFDMGKREIVKTIIEESEHLKTGFSDESRSFQDHFINKYVSALEEKHAYFL